MDESHNHHDNATQHSGHHDATQTVTKEQGGQFIDEGGLLFTRSMEEAALDGDGQVQVNDRDLGAVNALQVNLDHSGAEYIHAQKSFLTNSGARRVTSESSKLTNSGVLNLQSDSADFRNSSAINANVGQLTVNEGTIVFATAENATFTGGARPAVLQARTVEAQGDINAFAILGGELNASGNIHTTFSPAAAAAFGTALGAVLLLFGRVFRRK